MHHPRFLSAMAMFQESPIFCTPSLHPYCSVHLKLPFKSVLLRALKSHHVKHHLRDSTHYFSVVFPPLDALMGTLPPSETRDIRA